MTPEEMRDLSAEDRRAAKEYLPVKPYLFTKIPFSIIGTGGFLANVIWAATAEICERLDKLIEQKDPIINGRRVLPPGERRDNCKQRFCTCAVCAGMNEE